MPRSLMDSLLEAGKFKDAIDVSVNAASFTKRLVPHLFKDVFRLQASVIFSSSMMLKPSLKKMDMN